MKLPRFLKKSVQKAKSDPFSDFFLHASDEEKMKVFKEAAMRANQDQRDLVEKSKHLQAA